MSVIKKILCFILLSSFLLACTSAKLEEVQRLPSSNGGVDAIVAIRETNATVGTPTEVYVVREREVATGEPVLRVDKAEGLHVTWDNDILVVHADSARVFLYVPELVLKIHDGSKRVIRIRLDIKEQQ